jgi:hypothetical protein
MEIILSECDAKPEDQYEKPEGWSEIQCIYGAIYFDPKVTNELDVIRLAMEVDNGDVEAISRALGVKV